MRQLAQDLGLAPGTVMRTYRELEAEGLIASRRGQGTVVTGAPSGPASELAILAERFIADAVHLGFRRSEIRAAVEAALVAP